MSYTLIISEKPNAAKMIAEALAETKIKKVSKAGAYWLEFKKNNKKHICVPAVGHLLILNTKKGDGWKYPTFEADWVPTFTQKGSEFTKKYYNNIKKLSKDADSFIIATDFDIEGEVIGYNILRFLCDQKDAKRMKFSTLTKSDLVEAYDNKLPHVDFGQAEAGLTRHYLDFYWGINITRALTIAMKKFLKNNFVLVSGGRVQSPTLFLLTKREIEIKNFIPTPFWQLEIHLSFENKELVAMYEDDKIWEKEKAQKIFDNCKEKNATVKDIKKKKYKQLPPFPFDTTSLQTVAYNHFRFSPTQTMSIAEALYNQGYISYPRTGSQKLPAKIGYKKIIQNLSKISSINKYCKQLLSKKTLKPTEGKKSDSAHPAIFPTGNIPKNLNQYQQKLYSLIVRRFLSTFADPAIRESMKVILDVNGHNFLLNGNITIEKGWIEIYEKFVNFKEQLLPDLKEGQTLQVKKLLMLDKETQPPKKFTQGSIIKEMEKRGLGTKATRANIIQTLYDRGYVKEKNIEVTQFGEKVSEVLNKHCPKIVSEDLTKKFEEEMEKIQEKKKKREDVVNEAKKVLVGILEEFENKEQNIGEGLSEAYISSKKNEKIIGECPECGSILRIIRSKRTGKRFIGCKNYPKCNKSFPLPQFGNIKVLKEKCKECGLSVIQVYTKGKRPYKMCIDHKCKTKENWNKSSSE